MADVKKTTTKAPKVTKKANEVKTVDQLRDDLVKADAAHLESRKSHRLGELVNPHVLTVQRKDIARLHTAINAAHRSAIKEEN
ncbi:MAG: 50S ribosomal protein L29 [Candidatus Saccharimonadales bacterium]